MSSKRKPRKKPPSRGPKAPPALGSEALVRRAGEALASGWPTEAVRLYEQALAARPGAVELFHALGLALFQTGQVEAAAERLSAYLERYPADVEARGNLAAVLAAQGRLRQAADHYLEAAEQEPGHASFWRGAGNCLIQLGEKQEAAKAYARAQELAPDDRAVLNNHANVLSELGRHEEALPLYEKITREWPEDAVARSNLGAALLEMGRNQEAVEAFRAAVDLAPDLARSHLGLAKALHRLDDLEEAEVHARRALELTPCEDSWFRLGFVLQGLGNEDEARRCYKEAMVCNPRSAMARNNLGVLELNAGFLDYAKEWFRRALDLDPLHADAWSNTANILEKEGHLEQAEAAARQAVDLGGGLRAMVRLAYILQRQQRVEEAAATYARCLELDPEDSMGVVLHLASLGWSATPKRAPDAHVRRLFDNYSGYFDEHLVRKLEYRGPEILLEGLSGWLHARISPQGLDILDLGCGTGLCGVVLRRFARRLHGVDLSGRMLAKAARRQVYDILRQEELIAFMEACAERYDLIVAGDVFVYVGDLEPVFTAAARLLRPSGGFAFTVERHAGEGFRLGDSGRYFHSRDYLVDLAGDYGFSVLRMEEVSTRREAKKPTEGLMVVLQRKTGVETC
jgi:predicted TPR repeat methyltransferase